LPRWKSWCCKKRHIHHHNNMTDDIKSWSREELESAYVQRELQLRKALEECKKLVLVKEGLAAVLHIMDGNPQLIIPMKSLVESMIKIVDE